MKRISATEKAQKVPKKQETKTMQDRPVPPGTARSMISVNFCTVSLLSCGCTESDGKMNAALSAKM